MIKVAVRSRTISGGRLSLYLDYWPPIKLMSGKETRRENLKLYLYSRARTSLEKMHNRETESLAETIRSRRQIEVQSSSYGITRYGADIPVGEFLEEQTKKRTEMSQVSWNNMLYHAREQKFWSIPISQLDVGHCLRFRSALVDKITKKELMASTAHGYLASFRTAIRYAYKSGIIDHNLVDRFDTIKPSQAKREYLLLEELNQLIATPVRPEIVRTVSIFAALAGMRISDVRALKWENVTESEDGGAVLDFIMVKIKKRHVLPIGKQARGLMGKRPEEEALGAMGRSSRYITEKVPRSNSFVWPWIPCNGYLTDTIAKWVKDAGITKHITMHCFRHTYATLQLSAGTDLKTLCDLLGQSDIKTTQIYAKVLDESKARAANRVIVNLTVAQVKDEDESLINN